MCLFVTAVYMFVRDDRGPASGQCGVSAVGDGRPVPRPQAPADPPLTPVQGETGSPFHWVG